MGNPGLGPSYRLQANYTPHLPQVLCTIHLKPLVLSVLDIPFSVGSTDCMLKHLTMINSIMLFVQC